MGSQTARKLLPRAFEASVRSKLGFAKSNFDQPLARAARLNASANLR